PWWLIAHLPVLDNLQANRLMVYVFLALAILTAFVLQRLGTAAAGRLRAAAPVAIAGAVLIPLLPWAPLASRSVDVPPYFSSSAPAACGSCSSGPERTSRPHGRSSSISWARHRSRRGPSGSGGCRRKRPCRDVSLVGKEFSTPTGRDRKNL